VTPPLGEYSYTLVVFERVPDFFIELVEIQLQEVFIGDPLSSDLWIFSLDFGLNV